jgi:hypothetical protein
MAKLTREEFQALMNAERDAFRLSILGHAALEAELDDALAEAFEGRMPTDLSNLPFRTRLNLYIAAGVFPAEQAPGCAPSPEGLFNLRNELVDDVHDAAAKP